MAAKVDEAVVGGEMTFPIVIGTFHFVCTN
jgi:hypothetical protein